MPFLASLLGRIGFSLAGLAGIFSAYRSARIAFLLVLVDLVFLASKGVISFLISMLSNVINIGGSVPPTLCYILNQVEFFNSLTLYFSFLISVSLARLIIRLAQNIIS